MRLEKRLTKRIITEYIFKILMLFSLAIIAASMIAIVATIISYGLPSLTLEMMTQLPHGGYYLGKGGGIINAIVGSIYLAGGGTLAAILFALPIVFGINTFARNTRWAFVVRLALDIMWGIPTIVYGAFGFMIMLALGMRASLLAGIIVLGLVELPIIVRSIDEFIRMIPDELEEAALSVGATPLEVATTVITRQVLPGLVTAVLLGFGRSIGDAASVLFTAGYTDRMPTSLFQPTASLPLAVFFQLNTPFPEVQKRAYAAALILTLIILITSLVSRILAGRLSRFTIK